MAQLTAQTAPPWVIAHRGFSARFPENTFAAFDAALTAPIHAIELDIQMTRDGAPMVYHDQTLDKIGSGPRRVRNVDLEFLRGCDAGSWFDPAFCGQKLPLLRETLARYGRDCILLLEIKRRERLPERFRLLAEKIVAMARDLDLRSRICALSYRLDALRYIHQLDDGIGCVWNQLEPQFCDGDDFLLAYSVNIRGLNQPFVAKAQAAGKAVLTFTCNTEEHLRSALACGVNGIMSDDPEWLAKRLRELGAAG